MKTDHIKSVALVMEVSELWKHMECPDTGRWHVLFEVSCAFKDAFMDHMRGVAETAWSNGNDDRDIFIYDGSIWFLNDTDTHIVRSTEYDDIMEKEIPDDWWMGNIALMKEVLGKTV